LPDDVLTVLERHPWPGNLRELVSVMQVALALAGEQAVGVEHLPDSFLAEAGESAVHEHAPNDLGKLQRANGNLSSVARALGISRTTLYKRLREQGLVVSNE
jgi:transcriptional regulator of acetoin/glycerol metabolism